MALSAFDKAWAATKAYPRMRADLVEQITTVCESVPVAQGQVLLPLLQKHFSSLKGWPQESMLKKKITAIKASTPLSHQSSNQ